MNDIYKKKTWKDFNKNINHLRTIPKISVVSYKLAETFLFNIVEWSETFLRCSQ